MSDELTLDLFRAARDGLSPSAGELDRVRDRVRAAIDVRAAAAGTLAVSARALAKTAATKAALATVVAAAIGGGGIATWQAMRTPDAMVQPVIAMPAQREDPVAPPIHEVAVVPTPLPPPPKRPRPPRVAVALPAAPVEVAPSSLEQEVALVRAADGALKAGDASGALGIVRAAHPVQLVAELAAIEIDALCVLDRGDEARAHADAFLARWPRSALRDRVTRSCGGSR